MDQPSRRNTKTALAATATDSDKALGAKMRIYFPTEDTVAKSRGGKAVSELSSTGEVLAPTFYGSYAANYMCHRLAAQSVSKRSGGALRRSHETCFEMQSVQDAEFSCTTKSSLCSPTVQVAKTTQERDGPTSGVPICRKARGESQHATSGRLVYASRP